jgi:hypothetical protein
MSRRPVGIWTQSPPHSGGHSGAPVGEFTELRPAQCSAVVQCSGAVQCSAVVQWCSAVLVLQDLCKGPELTLP